MEQTINEGLKEIVEPPVEVKEDVTRSRITDTIPAVHKNIDPPDPKDNTVIKPIIPVNEPVQETGNLPDAVPGDSSFKEQPAIDPPPEPTGEDIEVPHDGTAVGTTTVFTEDKPAPIPHVKIVNPPKPWTPDPPKSKLDLVVEQMAQEMIGDAKPVPEVPKNDEKPISAPQVQPSAKNTTNRIQRQIQAARLARANVAKN
jgi:hypothetical protein